MKVYPYASYDDYVAAQNEGNRAKLRVVWVTRRTVSIVCAHRGPGVRTILCHGTRNGAEQRLFKEYYPNAEVIGTEIAETATLFAMTVRWDMQAARPDWLDHFDLVYSNAIDHAIYPQRTVRTWLDQLSPTGVLYIDHASDQRCNHSDRIDPLEIDDGEMDALIAECGGRIERHLAGLGPRNFKTRMYAVRKA